MVTAAEHRDIEGVIACSNERGLKLRGAEGWLNFSKWAEMPTIPPAGTPVVVRVDGKGFARSLTYAASAIVAPASSTLDSPARAPEMTGNGSPSKDTQIARMNALTNAVGILCTGGVVEPADVLELAARLEGWILR